MSLSTPSRRDFPAERELFAIVRLPEFAIVRSGLSRGEAEAYVRSSNYFRAIMRDEPRMVIFRQARQVQLEGQPIEVEGLPIYLDDDELELVRRARVRA